MGCFACWILLQCAASVEVARVPSANFAWGLSADSGPALVLRSVPADERPPWDSWIEEGYGDEDANKEHPLCLQDLPGATCPLLIVISRAAPTGAAADSLDKHISPQQLLYILRQLRI